jgi:glycosyltransferase involved in cell wall biosynthesis
LKKILHITYNSVLTSGILQSQVLTLLQQLHTAYPDELSFHLIACEKISDVLNRRKIREFRKQSAVPGIQITFLPKLLPSQLGFQRYRLFMALFSKIALGIDLVVLFTYSLYQILFKKIPVIHVRSYIPGILGVWLKKLTGVKLVFDPRGLIPEELQLTQHWKADNSTYRFWKKIERWLLKNADEVIVLSKPFAAHYLKIQPALKQRIIPCCVDTSRFTPSPDTRQGLRSQLNIDNRFVVLFVMGHYVPYQDFDTALEYFKVIYQKTHQQAFFLVMTPDKEKVETKLVSTELHANDYKVLNVGFQEMPAYLQTADAALLVRVPSLITEVSSPVKFAEYLACGIPVIAQPGIGDTEELIKTENIGVIIPSLSNTSSLCTFLMELLDAPKKTEFSLRSRLCALQYLSWNNYLDIYHQIYLD